MPLPWEAAVRVPSVAGLRHPVALPLPNSVAMLPQVSHSIPFPVSFVYRYGINIFKEECRKEHEALNRYNVVKND